MLTVTEEGKGRRTDVRDYRTQYRGGLGIRNYGSKGHVAGLKAVSYTHLDVYKRQVYISQISAGTLKKRSGYVDGISNIEK